MRQFIVDQLQDLRTTSIAITIASTPRACLPQGLKPEEVDQLLNSFTDALPSPRRGCAVVCLAIDLGFCGIDVSRLQLPDIDWRLGTVKRTKSRRQNLLPLPVVTGQALEAYLRQDGAVDLPRPRQGLQHLLVSERRAGTDGPAWSGVRAPEVGGGSVRLSRSRRLAVVRLKFGAKRPKRRGGRPADGRRRRSTDGNGTAVDL